MFTFGLDIERSVCRMCNGFLIVLFFSPSSQRSGTRRRYHDDGISDDEIEGKRTFDLEEKVYSERFGSDRLKRMEGKGTSHLHNSASALRFVCVWVWGKWGHFRYF